MVGIVAGAYSSIGICSPLYYSFSQHGRLSDYEKHVKEGKKKARKEAKKARTDKELQIEDEQPDAIEAPADVDVKEKEKAVTAADEAGDITESNAQQEATEKDVKDAKEVSEEKKAKNARRSKRYVKGNKK